MCGRKLWRGWGLLGILAIFGFIAPLQAAFYDEGLPVSTHPIGSPFYRHLAQETNIDLRELVKFEKRGFGRSEIITLIFISSATGKPLKDYGQRRLKDKVSLRELAAEAQLDYSELHKRVKEFKTRLEFLGDDLLPPPVYEVDTSTQVSPSQSKKKKDKRKKSP
ncbi:MAG: hypothetical protein KCHDKBKB_00050 [Elusimicrobia bacterium]|nr:hypothetical protein [Elusimicrobiota bacterium]